MPRLTPEVIIPLYQKHNVIPVTTNLYKEADGGVFCCGMGIYALDRWDNKSVEDSAYRQLRNTLGDEYVDGYMVGFDMATFFYDSCDTREYRQGVWDGAQCRLALNLN